jgi:uncharacterized sporulation protein YeaH/YhbH (DUF444 family)
MLRDASGSQGKKKVAQGPPFFILKLHLTTAQFSICKAFVAMLRDASGSQGKKKVALGPPFFIQLNLSINFFPVI